MEGMIREEQVERQYEMEYIKYMEQCVIEGRPSELWTYRILTIWDSVPNAYVMKILLKAWMKDQTCISCCSQTLPL